MPFKEIAPRAGERIGHAGVTVSWRRAHTNNGTLKLTVTIGKDQCVALGLNKGHRVRTFYEPETNRLKLVPSLDLGFKGSIRSWKKDTSDFCYTVQVPLDHVTIKDRKQAQAVPFDIADGEIVIRLPAWAAVNSFVKIAV